MPRALLRSVQSSAIEAIGYDRPGRWLFIRYRGSEGVYAYEDVEPQEWRALLEAPSKGRFVNAAIKPRHRYVRLAKDRPWHRRGHATERRASG